MTSWTAASETPIPVEMIAKNNESTDLEGSIGSRYELFQQRLAAMPGIENDFVETMKMELTVGRTFSRSMG